MALPADPDALRATDFLQLAEEFYRAYDLPSRPPPNWPRYFMLCHAIELGLKAYLAHHGASHQQLTRAGVRHDFGKLMSDAVAAGLAVKATAQNETALLDEAHSEFWHRYPRGHRNPADAGKPVFIIEHFAPHARDFLDTVRGAMF
jgi:hypothetical protein